MGRMRGACLSSIVCVYVCMYVCRYMAGINDVCTYVLLSCELRLRNVM